MTVPFLYESEGACHPERRRREGSAPISRSLNLWIFPVAVFGSSSTNTIQRGYLYGARRSFTNALSSASSAGLARWPRASTTNASGFTSSSLSSAPTTPASTTAGCSASALSTSAGDTHMPLALIMSSVRPAYQKYPSATSTPVTPTDTSGTPVRTHSPSIVRLVRSCWFQKHEHALSPLTIKLPTSPTATSRPTSSTSVAS